MFLGFINRGSVMLREGTEELWTNKYTEANDQPQQQMDSNSKRLITYLKL